MSEPWRTQTSDYTIPHDIWKEHHHGASKQNFNHKPWNDLKSNESRGTRSDLIEKIEKITGPNNHCYLCIPVDIRRVMDPLPPDPKDCSTTLLRTIFKILSGAVKEKEIKVEPMGMTNSNNACQPDPQPTILNQPCNNNQPIQDRAFYEWQYTKLQEEKAATEGALAEAARMQNGFRHSELTMVLKSLEKKISELVAYARSLEAQQEGNVN